MRIVRNVTRKAMLALGILVAPLAAMGGQDPASCTLTGAVGGALKVASAPGGASFVWEGSKDQTLRLRFAIVEGVPTIADLAISGRDGRSRSVVQNARPEYEIVTGLRRISNQQLVPLRSLNVPLTQETIDQFRWEPFWDAPLHVEKVKAERRMGSNPPPADGIAGTDQPGLPRKPEEIQRSVAKFDVKGCSVQSDGTKAVISFPGVTAGSFSGNLQYTLWRGTNLIRMELVARTNKPWVAYKYDAGLQGLRRDSETRVVWRDTSGAWQKEYLDGDVHRERVALPAANRVILAERAGVGAVAVFPAPHRFFWARELATNRSYSWFRRDKAGSFGLGIRQAEEESEDEFAENWALYSARPGTDQLMPVFLYPDAGSAKDALGRVLEFTRGDRFAAIPGYKVMNHHYHMDLGERLIESGSLATRVPDLTALRAVGLDIVSQIDSVFVGQRPAGPASATSKPRDELAIRDASIRGAKLHSDRDFLVLPNQEVYNSPLGGHTDLLFSRPVYWTSRVPGQSFEESHPEYGKVYRVGSAEDFMKMARQEGAIISMPHPRTKGSTGFPDAIRHEPYFRDRAYNGVGVRWGMGLDGSERRTCEYRCLPLLDDMSNWMTSEGLPLKYMISISEVRHQQPGDDIYASAPVMYVQLDKLPPPDDVTPLVKALEEGRSFVTTGEVLLHSVGVEGSGANSSLVADVEWTFPLEFVEVVWGDGKETGRKVVPVKSLPPFGRHRFVLPFDARGKRWVRFAAWDSAYEGAMSQPQLLH